VREVRKAHRILVGILSKDIPLRVTKGASRWWEHKLQVEPHLPQRSKFRGRWSPKFGVGVQLTTALRKILVLRNHRLGQDPQRVVASVVKMKRRRRRKKKKWRRRKKRRRRKRRKI
jgi:hypothetical protein